MTDFWKQSATSTPIECSLKYSGLPFHQVTRGFRCKECFLLFGEKPSEMWSRYPKLRCKLGSGPEFEKIVWAMPEQNEWLEMRRFAVFFCCFGLDLNTKIDSSDTAGFHLMTSTGFGRWRKVINTSQLWLSRLSRDHWLHREGFHQDSRKFVFWWSSGKTGFHQKTASWRSSLFHPDTGRTRCIDLTDLLEKVFTRIKDTPLFGAFRGRRLVSVLPFTSLNQNEAVAYARTILVPIVNRSLAWTRVRASSK